MDKRVERRFIGERTRSLATVVLTRREDLKVTAADGDAGPDLYVRIEHGKGGGERKFGVVLRGEMATVGPERANRAVRPALESLSKIGNFPCPVCLFFFTMEKDEGWYTWVDEPVVSDDGVPRLDLHSEANCRPLDKPAVDDIVDRVSRWYDTLDALGMNRPVRSVRNGSGLAVLHRIIDAQARWDSEHGSPPRLLKLPVPWAYDLAKLGRDHLGDLSERMAKGGVRALEQEGLLGMRVELVRGAKDLEFE
jgi:hypothetical protein